MASVFQNISVDCTNPYRLAEFWSQVLDRPVHPDDGPEDDEVAIVLDDGTLLLFIQVPEPKTVKNRLHFCLKPLQARDDEVDRLFAAGATLADDRRKPDGTGWAVLADPEGNEFCVLRSDEERAATS